VILSEDYVDQFQRSVLEKRGFVDKGLYECDILGEDGHSQPGPGISGKKTSGKDVSPVCEALPSRIEFFPLWGLLRGLQGKRCSPNHG